MSFEKVEERQDSVRSYIELYGAKIILNKTTRKPIAQNAGYETVMSNLSEGCDIIAVSSIRNSPGSTLIYIGGNAEGLKVRKSEMGTIIWYEITKSELQNLQQEFNKSKQELNDPLLDRQVVPDEDKQNQEDPQKGYGCCGCWKLC